MSQDMKFPPPPRTVTVTNPNDQDQDVLAYGTSVVTDIQRVWWNPDDGRWEVDTTVARWQRATGAHRAIGARNTNEWTLSTIPIQRKTEKIKTRKTLEEENARLNARLMNLEQWAFNVAEWLVWWTTDDHSVGPGIDKFVFKMPVVDSDTDDEGSDS